MQDALPMPPLPPVTRATCPERSPLRSLMAGDRVSLLSRPRTGQCRSRTPTAHRTPLSHLLGRLASFAIADGDPCTGVAQRDAGRAPDAAAPARDEGDMSREVSVALADGGG